MKKKVRGTQATYIDENGEQLCDLLELATHLSENVGHVPERVGFGRACELHLLAKNFLVLEKLYQKQKLIKEIVSEELN